jgi:hypothetical protein
MQPFEMIQNKPQSLFQQKHRLNDSAKLQEQTFLAGMVSHRALNKCSIPYRFRRLVSLKGNRMFETCAFIVTRVSLKIKNP